MLIIETFQRNRFFNQPFSAREALWSSFQASVSNVASSSSSSSRPFQEPKKVKIERKYRFAGEQVVLVFFLPFFMSFYDISSFTVRLLKFLKTRQKQRSGLYGKTLLPSHQVRYPLHPPFQRLQHPRPIHLHLSIKRH
jgi:hypothetical protein